MLGFLAGKLLGGLFQSSESGGRKGLSAVDRIVKKITGDRTEEIDADTKAFARAMTAYGREFHKPTNWLDSIVQGINRLIRPTMAIAVLVMMGMPFFDVALFKVVMAAYALVPEWIVYMFSGVFGFYFAARELHHHRSTKINAEALKNFQAAKAEYDKPKAQKPEKKKPRIVKKDA